MGIQQSSNTEPEQGRQKKVDTKRERERHKDANRKGHGDIVIVGDNRGDT